MDLYLGLEPFPEVPAVLAALREAGFRTAILSNGSPMMLDALVRRAGLEAISTLSCRLTPFRAFKTAPRTATNMRFVRLISPAARSRSSPPTPGMPTAPRTSACGSSGATAMASVASACPAAPDFEIRTLAELRALLGVGSA